MPRQDVLDKPGRALTAPTDSATLGELSDYPARHYIPLQETMSAKLVYHGLGFRLLLVCLLMLSLSELVARSASREQLRAACYVR